MADQLRRFFLKEHAQFVDVAQAIKERLPFPVDTRGLPDQDLKPFNFVVYFTDRPNWLVMVGNPNKYNQKTMAEWVKHFGPGFVAVFAAFRTGPRFIDADWKPVPWPETLAAGFKQLSDIAGDSLNEYKSDQLGLF